MSARFDPVIGRKTWRTLEPYHGAIYFASEAADAYREVGVDDRMRGYFASRSAPMGAVCAEVVIATFFNFDHDLVRRSMDGLWSQVTPESMREQRMVAADRMIRRLVGDDAVASSEMQRAAALARTAAEVAVVRPEGRPLFAGHAALDWPTEPHLVLWHAQTLLREFRGDGHIAALVAADLDGCEALVLHAASGEVPATVLRSSRQRTNDAWNQALASLRERGWIDGAAHDETDRDGTLTEVGRAARAEIEVTTDRLAAAPYATLGPDGCDELRGLVRPWSAAMSVVFGR
ncbi:MAG: SCO6745 family protein [Ilumatobacter sp.]|jgi:hypothetical protein|uniref:SCO6745 family protein n=1 Tax=Ilumatobacter sp. TaxID=1967498 RepID=UPI00391BD4A1